MISNKDFEEVEPDLSKLKPIPLNQRHSWAYKEVLGLSLLTCQKCEAVQSPFNRNIPCSGCLSVDRVGRS